MGDINGMSEKSVSCLYEESDGKLWIGTDGGGINLYDSQTGFFKHFQSSYGDKVISIAPVSEKALLVSVYTKGLFIRKEHGVYRPFTIVNDSINFRQCFYGYLPRAHRVSENKIYILSKDAWIYDISNKNSLHSRLAKLPIAAFSHGVFRCGDISGYERKQDIPDH